MIGASAAFFKGHGLGNDYLVFEVGDEWSLAPSAIQAVCDRWEGPGSDGIVLRLSASGGTERLRMFNPDGSEFERSGNGLRVFAAYLSAGGRIGSEAFDVEVGGDLVTMQVHQAGANGEYDVSVDMGRASLDTERVRFDARALDAAGRLHLANGAVEVVPVSIGNPHCVVFREDLSDRALEALGPALATHPAFAEGTNVQLAWPAGEGDVRVRIWERGVGRTSASGTSACAVAVAAVHRGLVPAGPVQVLMEGGVLQVDVSPELDVVLRGPVRDVYEGRLTHGFLRALDDRTSSAGEEGTAGQAGGGAEAGVAGSAP